MKEADKTIVDLPWPTAEEILDEIMKDLAFPERRYWHWYNCVLGEYFDNQPADKEKL